MEELIVSVPFSRLLDVVERIGAQSCDECPTQGHECWRHRKLEAYLVSEHPADVECQNCWLQFILMGN